MLIEHAPVVAAREVAENVHVLQLHAPRIARAVQPGQFVNIKPDGSYDPLLQRAYSVHRVLEGDVIELIYNVHGKGSRIFAAKRPGDVIPVLGPLGTPFRLDDGFRTAILVSGGVGIAPMPVLGSALLANGIDVVSLHGSRTATMVPDDGRLVNPVFATDDGTLGYHGNVVEALRVLLESTDYPDLKIFACGPNPMLLALARFCDDRGIPIEVSLECQMACGVGICQGCPVEMRTGDRRYSLVCTAGPNYLASDIVIESLPVEHG